jgi:hypothetical protein
MRLTIIFKYYSNLAEPSVIAYINDHRTVGGKPWGGGHIFAEVDMPDGEADVEIWRTKRIKGHSIEFAAKVNGVPVGKNAKYVFEEVPEEYRKIYNSFSTGIREVPPECKKLSRFDREKEDKELESDGRFYRIKETKNGWKRVLPKETA